VADDAPDLDAADRKLLDLFQRDFPLVPRPFEALAERLGITEAEVLERLRHLQDSGRISRVGAVLAPRRLGGSTLAAMAVPEERLDEVAALVSACREVNHNYEREHPLNLWFVVTAPDEAGVAETLRQINARTGLPVLDLPLTEEFHIDLGFPLQWTG
jgi:DNA-binding Lrp family transcriptional regulator